MTSKRSNYELLARGLVEGESGTEGLQGGAGWDEAEKPPLRVGSGGIASELDSIGG